MNRANVLKNIRERFKGDIVNIVDKSSKRVYIEIKPESITKVARYIFKDLDARLSIYLF